MTKKIIYRRYRKMTEEEQKEKFGFSEADLIKEESWLAPPYSDLFESECLVSVDSDKEYMDKQARIELSPKKKIVDILDCHYTDLGKTSYYKIIDLLRELN